LLLWAAACVAPSLVAAQPPASPVNPPEAIYRVRRLARPLAIDADWSKPAWADAAVGELTFHMGDKPEHFPRTQFKAQYDDAALYVIFRVEDRYVRAVAEKHNDPVCTDSCVEFFFSPVDDVRQGYFNLEVNCGGTMLLHYQRAAQVEQRPIGAEQLALIEVGCSLPRRVDPELVEPTTWTVEYRLPFDAFAAAFPQEFPRPTSGTAWKGNFYKCGDRTSRPHWLTWAPVDRPQPDFHRPEFFGRLEFD
jgi:hypothetical protein